MLSHTLETEECLKEIAECSVWNSVPCSSCFSELIHLGECCFLFYSHFFLFFKQYCFYVGDFQD